MINLFFFVKQTFKQAAHSMLRLRFLTFLIIGVAPSLVAQIPVLSLTSTGQTGASGTWTNTLNIPLIVRIVATGGGGGNAISYLGGTTILGSTGALTKGEFTVNPCATILLIAGGKGGNGGSNGNIGSGGGGGAGSGAINMSTGTLLLLAAGGTAAGTDTRLTLNSGLGGSATLYGTGNGGSNGEGYGAGGGGFNSPGAGSNLNNCGTSGGGQVSLTGISTGGPHCGAYNGGDGGSGMAGGGGGSDLAGGGGGYTGGNAGTLNYGPYSAATSFNAGANQDNVDGTNATIPNDGTIFLQIITPNIPILPQPLAVTPLVTNVKCNGGSDGVVILTPTGGKIPYSILLVTPTKTLGPFETLTSVTFGDLPAGTYPYTISDANGCSKTGSVTITQPPSLSISITKTDVKCNGGSDGTATITATAGTPAYSFKLGTTTNGTGSFTGLAAGTYIFTVTDANTCSKTGSVTVSQPPPLSISSSKTDVKCNGGSDGTATITATAGTPAYSFKLGTTMNGTGSFTGLAAGTYIFTVTDANTCSKTGSVTIGQPLALSLSRTVTNVLCNGASTGAINLTVTGGTPGYTYAWSNGAVTEDLTNIAAGTYVVTATDAAGCSNTISTPIAQPPALNLNKTTTNVLCNGASTGAIDLSVTGGTLGYTYAWSNGATSQDLTNIAAGTYTATVTDGSGCQASTSATITQNSPITVNTPPCQFVYSGYGSNCINLSATASGGGGTFTYLWNPGAKTTASIQVCPTATTTYTVKVTDQYGCFVIKTVSVVVNNVRCGSSKVFVCHSNGTLCVSTTAVADHLAHGDKLGICGSPSACTPNASALMVQASNDPQAAASALSPVTMLISPNPAESSVNLELTVNTEGDAEIRLVDITGKTVLRTRRKVYEGQNNISLDISALASGLYLCQYNNGQQNMEAVRLVKQ